MHVTTFTVDVEDWFHVCGVGAPPMVDRNRWRVAETTGRLLDLFAELGIRGTFFMLGSVAAAEPGLAPRIVDEGHEIASHGYSHRPVYELSPDEFHEELTRTADIIVSQTGVKPVGFRAPQWSLGKRTPWAFDILAREGYRYDSSCTPLPLIGEPKGSKIPYVIEADSGKLWEIPPLVTPGRLTNLPCGGGWGLRMFPLKTVLRGIKAAHDSGNPAVFFLHPREVDPGGPRLKLPLLKSFAAYGPRKDSTSRLKCVAETGVSIPLRELVDSWPSAS
ncbi:MAG: polysaccharide deacetylase family protein [Desulfuromonadales bacterium]